MQPSSIQGLSGSHTGQRIAEELDAVVSDFGLKDKIWFVVTNNASNMLKAMHFFPGVDEGNWTASHVDDVELWEDLSTDDLEVAFGETGTQIAASVTLCNWLSVEGCRNHLLYCVLPWVKCQR